MASTIDTSGIDETKPVHGTPTTQSVRDNFAAIKTQLGNAKTDIESLQAYGSVAWIEAVQDTVGAMVSANTETGLSVTYDDVNGKLDFNVNDPVITLNGDVSGSATMTDLGNVTITTAVADDSHNHTSATITDFTEAAQDAVGVALTDTASINLTYNDLSNQITADAIFGSTAGTVAEGTAPAAAIATHEADVTAHPASSIVNTPSGGIAATTVQAALNELDTEKVAKAGDTMTGPLILNTNLQFESGESRITYNDGGGNFNFRIGNYWVNSADSYSVTGKSAIHIHCEHEVTVPNFNIDIGPDPATAVKDAAITWAKSFVLKADGTFTWGGSNVLTAANHNSTGDPHTQYALDTDLSAHLTDPTAAHTASAISILDAAGKYTSTDVEGALAEAVQGGAVVKATTSLSGAYVEFSVLPSWAKRFTVTVNGASTTGTSPVIIQLGTSTGIIATGYSGRCENVTTWGVGASFSSGFVLAASGSAANSLYGNISVTQATDASGTCIASGNIYDGSALNSVTGSVALVASIYRIRITTVGGVDTFDAGTLTITYM